MLEVLRYVLPNGRSPITEWLDRLRDKAAKARILSRLRQLEAGNFGDAVPVGGGVIELRIDYGPGFRIYCGRHGSTIVVLLHGGDKSSQSSDIRKAQRFWLDWKGGQA